MTTEFADVPPGETSLEAEKRLYSQASSVKKKNEKEAQQKENTGFYTGIKLIWTFYGNQAKFAIDKSQ